MSGISVGAFFGRLHRLRWKLPELRRNNWIASYCDVVGYISDFRRIKNIFRKCRSETVEKSLAYPTIRISLLSKLLFFWSKFLSTLFHYDQTTYVLLRLRRDRSWMDRDNHAIMLVPNDIVRCWSRTEQISKNLSSHKISAEIYFLLKVMFGTLQFKLSPSRDLPSAWRHGAPSMQLRAEMKVWAPLWLPETPVVIIISGLAFQMNKNAEASIFWSYGKNVGTVACDSVCRAALWYFSPHTRRSKTRDVIMVLSYSAGRSWEDTSSFRRHLNVRLLGTRRINSFNLRLSPLKPWPEIIVTYPQR